MCPELGTQEAEKFPFSIRAPGLCHPWARPWAVPLGAAPCPRAALGCLTAGQTDRHTAALRRAAAAKNCCERRKSCGEQRGLEVAGPITSLPGKERRSKSIHGRDSGAGERALGALSQLGTAPSIPAATFAQILAFCKLFFLFAAGRRGREGLESPIPSPGLEWVLPILSHLTALAWGSTGRKRGGQQGFPVPFPSLRKAPRFSASHPTDISEPTGVISSGSLGEEREALARGGRG